MVGFFDPVIATALKNFATGAMETAETLRGNVLLFPNADLIQLFSEVHTSGTDGATGAGWSTIGTRTRKDFNLDTFPAIVATTKAVLIECSVGIDWSITQPVGTLNNSYIYGFNQDPAFNAGGGFCSVSCFSQAGAPTDYFQNDRTLVLPVNPSARILRFETHWPNLAVILPVTYVSAYIVGIVR